MRIPLFVLLMVLSFSALAEDPAPQDGERVQIVTDQQAGAVRFVIDGQQVAIIDATGLHVAKDMFFSGITNDYGETGFQEHAASLDTENAEQ